MVYDETGNMCWTLFSPSFYTFLFNSEIIFGLAIVHYNNFCIYAVNNVYLMRLTLFLLCSNIFLIPKGLSFREKKNESELLKYTLNVIFNMYVDVLGYLMS